MHCQYKACVGAVNPPHTYWAAIILYVASVLHCENISLCKRDDWYNRCGGQALRFCTPKASNTPNPMKLAKI